MKQIFTFIVVVFLLFSLTTTAAMAQNRMYNQASGCCGGGGHRGGDHECCHHTVSGYQSTYPEYSRPRVKDDQPAWLEPETYSPATLETVSGEVIDVYQVTVRRGRGYGLHLLLRTSDQTIDVHLGPTRYLDNEDFRIERGSSVDVKGEWVPTDGLPTMTAFEVKQGDDVLILRDEDGAPLWREQRSTKSLQGLS